MAEAGDDEDGPEDPDFETQEHALPIDGRLVLLVFTSTGIREFDLIQLGRHVVGRSTTAEICIADGSVSRAHAEITVSPTRVVIRDLGSRNGTTINGRSVSGDPLTLRLGDKVRFGSVSAHLHFARAIKETLQLSPVRQFDDRVIDEGERCLRSGRSMAIVAVETAAVAPDELRILREAVRDHLGLLDTGTERRAGRVDILYTECEKPAALERARRLEAICSGRGLTLRVGVAVFPGDSPVPDSLALAADHALPAAAGIAAARQSARQFTIGKREIVVADPEMVRVFGLVERFAKVPMPVLVNGETGSGKEIVAEALHELGPRADKPLIKLNCAAVPENLLESELFGYERGAFSGAAGAKPGLFEEADGGTLFLDEMGDMAPALQAKLLRVLEDQRVRRLGAVKDRTVNVRIVAATHRDLAVAVAEGRFRQDLFYRLNTLSISVPPLRARKNEIALLAERFAAEVARSTKRDAVSLSPAVVTALEAYAWPGNIRELRNVVSRAVVTCAQDEIGLQDLPGEISAPPAGAPTVESGPRAPAQAETLVVHLALEDELRALERKRILEAVDACQGNQTKAAEMLQMPRRTLVAKLAAMGFDGPRRRRDTDQ